MQELQYHSEEGSRRTQGLEPVLFPSEEGSRRTQGLEPVYVRVSSYDSMSGTLKGTLFTTAKAGLGINTGTGSTLEVMSSDAVRAVTVSGYREALLTTGVPVGRLAETEIADRGNGYVTAIFQGDNYFTRFELNDMLHGLGWKMTGYTTSIDPAGQGTTCHEMWTKHIKSRKHDR